MAANPAFASTIVLGQAITPATLDTSLTAPTHTTTVLTGASTGTKIEQISCMQVATTSGACCVNLFLFNGSTYYLFDFFAMPLATITTTSEVTRVDNVYSNLWLPSASWSLVCSTTVTAGQSAFNVFAFGGSF